MEVDMPIEQNQDPFDFFNFDEEEEEEQPEQPEERDEPEQEDNRPEVRDQGDGSVYYQCPLGTEAMVIEMNDQGGVILCTSSSLPPGDIDGFGM
jgi:hypothetical protein